MNFIVWGAQHDHVVSMSTGLSQTGWQCLGIADESPGPLAASLAGQFSCPVVPDGRSLLQQHDVDLVVSAALNARKPGIALAAIEAGAHFFADKPIALDMKALQRIHDAATRSDRNVWAWFSLRYEPASHKLRQIITNGDIGEPVAVEACRPHRLNPPSRPHSMFDDALYGGVLADLTCHDIDLFLWLTASVPAWIAAHETCTRFHTGRGDITDLALVMFGGSSVAAVFRGDWLTPGRYPLHGDCRFRVIGTEGVAEVRWAGPTLNPASTDILLFSDRLAPTRIDPSSFDTPSIYQEITSCLADGTPMTLTSTDVFRSMSLTLLAKEAARNGSVVSGVASRLLS